MPSITNLNVRSIKQISFFGTPWKDIHFQVEYILKNIMQQKLTDLTKAEFFFWKFEEFYCQKESLSPMCLLHWGLEKLLKATELALIFKIAECLETTFSEKKIAHEIANRSRRRKFYSFRLSSPLVVSSSFSLNMNWRNVFLSFTAWILPWCLFQVKCCNHNCNSRYIFFPQWAWLKNLHYFLHIICYLLEKRETSTLNKNN